MPEGANLFALKELLRPPEATAHRCGLPWSAPLLVYEAGRLDDVALARAGERYAECLRQRQASEGLASEALFSQPA